MTTYKLNLSTTEPNNDVGLIKIRQDDTMTQQLSVTVYEHDKLVDLTGYDIYLNSKMPNQSTVRDKVTDLINPKNGHFSYTLIDSFWQCLGDISLWFSFEINGTRDSTANFEYRVIQGHCKEVNQGNYIWEFEELKRKLEEMGLNLANDYKDFKERLDVLLEMFKAMNTYSKEEIDRMLIKLIAGEKISATFTMDYKDKVVGSLVENPSVMKFTTSQDMPIPSDSRWAETTTTVYIQTGTLGDNKIATTSATEALNSRKIMASFNILEDFKRKFPSLSVTLDLLKKYVTGLEVSAYAKGSNSAGNFCQINNYFDRWIGGNVASNETNEFKKISLPIIVPKNYILADGTVISAISSKESDGKTPSILSVDYISLDYTVELSLRDIFATKEELAIFKKAVETQMEVTKNEIKKDIDDFKKYTNAELAKKQDKITDSGLIKATLTGGAINNNDDPVYYRKVNNLVIISGYLRVPEGGGAVIWTPPPGYAPKYQSLVRVTFSNSDTTRTAIVRFWGGKMLSVYNNSSGDYCYIEAIYYVD
ncbi:BppU family phage baseplate upper protein [Carnobacterium divergens]|uniref:BppU family phage baseplate upper protein n=1 Tax=Carnobacterium divergens TaxID=2748 RepID=UPI0039B083E9